MRERKRETKRETNRRRERERVLEGGEKERDQQAERKREGFGRG
jgi:hypothetical protein